MEIGFLEIFQLFSTFTIMCIHIQQQSVMAVVVEIKSIMNQKILWIFFVLFYNFVDVMNVRWTDGVIIDDCVSWAELNWARLGWTGMRWAGLRWDELNWAGLGWAELGWAGLGWDDLNWAGLILADVNSVFQSGADSSAVRWNCSLICTIMKRSDKPVLRLWQGK